MKTEKQQEIINFLESIVHGRYTIGELNRMLSNMLNEEISLINVSKENYDEGNDDELSDYNYMFGSDRKEAYGYYDIYMLPTRRDVMYITEIAYELNV